jgi:UPF0755 protein
MHKRRLKKSVKLSLFIILFLFLFSICFFFFKLSGFNKDEVIEYEVKKGSSIYNVLVDLDKNNIIRDSLFSKIYVKLFNISGFQAGTYDLNRSYSSIKIINMLRDGDVNKKDEVNITFKEGKSIVNLVKLIVDNTNNTEEDVYNLLKDKEYIDSLISKYWFLEDVVKNKDIRYALEGYLFPDTYTILKTSSVNFIFTKMLDRMNQIITPYKDEIEQSNYSIHEILTMASIVELEGKFDDDRAMISGVLFKRLENYWTLGSDVTSYYAAELDMSENPIIFKSALELASPYNTSSLNKGYNMLGKLPIGPICSPGKASILATLNPVESDYWFFIADCRTMTTIFNKTNAMHDKSVAEIKASGCKF